MLHVDHVAQLHPEPRVIAQFWFFGRHLETLGIVFRPIESEQQSEVKPNVQAPAK
jgi:hypothetical protein